MRRAASATRGRRCRSAATEGFGPDRQESDEREAPSPEQVAVGRHDPGPAVLVLPGARWRRRRSRIGGAYVCGGGTASARGELLAHLTARAPRVGGRGR